MENAKKITRLFDIIVCLSVVGIIGLVSTNESVRAEIAKKLWARDDTYQGTVNIKESNEQIIVTIDKTTTGGEGSTGQNTPKERGTSEGLGGEGKDPTTGSGETQQIDPAKVYAIFVTSYNPEKGQTDSSPCTGASGIDQCKKSKEGVRMLALSQDLIGRASWKPFHYGETVIMKSDLSDPRCNGEFLLVDTMNKRYKNRGDLFFMDRKDNISCQAWVYKK